MDGVSGVPVAFVRRRMGCKYNYVVVIIYTIYLNCSTFTYLYFIFYFNRVRNNVTQNIVNKLNGKFF